MSSRTAAAVVLSLSLALAACGEGDPDVETESGARSTAPADGTSPPKSTEGARSATVSDPARPTDTTSPSGPVATGQAITTGAVTLRLSEDLAWELPPPVDQGGATLTQAAHVAGSDEWAVAVIEAPDATTVKQLRADALRAAEEQYDDATAAPVRILDGERAYVVEATGLRSGGAAQSDDLLYEVGVARATGWVVLSFRAPQDSLEERGRIEASLASVRWQ